MKKREKMKRSGWMWKTTKRTSKLESDFVLILISFELMLSLIIKESLLLLLLVITVVGVLLAF
jgi:hypothetical protein